MIKKLVQERVLELQDILKQYEGKILNAYQRSSKEITESTFELNKKIL